MYYYKFDKEHFIYKKYKQFITKSNDELKPIYEYIKKFKAKYIYKIGKKVLGFILPFEAPPETKKRFIVKEQRSEGILVYPKDNGDKKAIKKTLKWHDAKLKKELFNNASNYLGFILSPDFLMVESFDILDKFKENEIKQDDFEQVINTIKTIKDKQNTDKADLNEAGAAESSPDIETPIKDTNTPTN